MLTKDKLLDSIKDFPTEFSINDLVERLIFVQKIENGIAQGERGETYTTEELKSTPSRTFEWTMGRSTDYQSKTGLSYKTSCCVMN